MNAFIITFTGKRPEDLHITQRAVTVMADTYAQALKDLKQEFQYVKVINYRQIA